MLINGRGRDHPGNLVRLMLNSEVKWNAIGKDTHEILKTKEEEERRREQEIYIIQLLSLFCYRPKAKHIQGS